MFNFSAGSNKPFCLTHPKLCCLLNTSDTQYLPSVHKMAPRATFVFVPYHLVTRCKYLQDIQVLSTVETLCPGVQWWVSLHTTQYERKPRTSPPSGEHIISADAPTTILYTGTHTLQHHFSNWPSPMLASTWMALLPLVSTLPPPSVIDSAGGGVRVVSGCEIVQTLGGHTRCKLIEA